MKNILEVCLSPDFGGLELHMRDFTKFLDAKAVLNCIFANIIKKWRETNLRA